MAFNAIDKMIQVRSNLIMNEPFYSILAMRLDMIEDPTAEALWTDCKVIGYNPDWVRDTNHAEILARMCEIVGHIAHLHPFRRDNRDERDWNVACDRALWSMLKSSGYMLPPDVHHDPSDDGASAEAIYEKMQSKKPPQGGQQPSKDPGSQGEVRDYPGDDARAQEDDWKVAVVQAARAAKMIGKLPGGLELLIEQITQPAIDWRAALRKFVDECAKNDYSWLRPSRRYVAQGLYLPQIRSERLPAILVGVDTSGSMSKEELDSAASELTSIMQECRPEKVHVAYCNTRVFKAEEYEPDETIKFGEIERGGTDLTKIFSWAEEQGIDFVCAIVFSDLETPFGEEPEYPVLWATKGKAVAPYGDTLEIKF